jgi:mono/diheme cytochrome c family protein
VLSVGVGVSACGGDDEGDETTTETTTTTDEASAGRAVFVSSCGSCHTLSDAGTSGAVGPNLDGTSLTQEQIALQVRNGGGAMPAFEGQLSDEEIDEVSAYVAQG